MENYQELNPSYSRICIDYTQPDGKKVLFEYPNKTGIFGWVLNWTMAAMLNFVIFRILPFFIILAVIGSIFNISFLLPDVLFAIFIGLFIGMVLISFIIPLFLYKNKKFILKMPKLSRNVLINKDYKYVIFDKLEKPEFEIHLFDNIFLDYNATRDFGKYLEKVEIKEHDFKYVSVSEWLSKVTFGLIKKNNIKEQNDKYWKAKFYFSEIPKSGFIEVFFY